MKRARAIRDMNAWPWPIEIDGGIDAQTAADAVESGVQILVAGNAIFNHKNPTQALKNLRVSAEMSRLKTVAMRSETRTDEGFS
ncbi:MAG: hypothetical protein SGI90_06450 [Candidatus Eisenbacteria bacterium]|nr:hypothetical protein [Candidatus Eisenbacteria bacterium]